MKINQNWQPDEGMPAYLAAQSFLKSRLESTNKEERRCVSEALNELEALKNGLQIEQTAAWYYTTFCQAWGFGTRRGKSISTGRGWLTPAQTKRHLGIGEDSPHYLAIKPSNWVSWATIDIDEGSRYHPMSLKGEGIEPVKKALVDIGLEAAIEFQSSTSGGIHLWYPLATMIQSWELAVAMEECLLMRGLEIKSGVLELRPNKKRYGSDYLIIRAPLTGEGNSYWAPDYSDFGLHQDLQLFQQIWIDTQTRNQFKPLEAQSNQTEAPSPNRRRPVKSKYSLQRAQEKLAIGFTGRGQSQEMKLAALMTARLLEGIEDIKALEERVYELLENSPGFEHFCSHKNEIKRGTYLSKSELNKALQMTPGGYKNTWKEESNLRRRQQAIEAALGAIETACKAGLIFRSENKAIDHLNSLGAPNRSWWRKNANQEYLKQVREILINRQNDCAA